MSVPDALVAEFAKLARISFDLRPQVEVLAFRYIAADRVLDDFFFEAWRAMILGEATLDGAGEAWSAFRMSFGGGVAEDACGALMDMRTALDRAV